jgi:uncharacterized membrane protein SpoIIM required for sporulation
MRETSFIKQNKEKWKEFEQDLNQENVDPDKMSDLFIQITDDLSYSRTFYPNRSVRVYLNNIAQQIFYSIYKNRKTQLGRFSYFWTHELPDVVWESRREFRLAFWVFVLAFGIGVLSCAMDAEFPRMILGDDYVDMTIENIESGDPMAVYKQRGELGMSVGITINNLWVAFQTFALGVFFALGTLFYLVKNAIMVGAFQYFFYEQGVFLESFLTIWIHGTLEISAIVIAAAAGLTMGKGLVFPGTLTRMQAFQISARRGVKIMMGIVPIFIIAGFLEGFLTRQTETPDIIRGLFILACLSFVILYFWWLPNKRGKEGLLIPPKEGRLPADNNQLIDFTRIKSSGEVFSDVFVFYKKNILGIGGLALASALFYSGMVFSFTPDSPTDLFSFPQTGMTQGTEFVSIFEYLILKFVAYIGVIHSFFVNEAVPFLIILNTFIFSCLTFVSFTYLIKTSEKGEQQLEEERPAKTTMHHILNFAKIAAVILIMNLFLMTSDWYTVILIIPFAFPVLILWMYIMCKENIGLITGLGRTFHLLSGSVGKLLGTYLLTLTIGISFFMITDTSLIWIYIKLVSMNLVLTQGLMDQFAVISLTFISTAALYLIYPLLISGVGLLYHTLLEIKEAPTLKNRVQNIGNARVIQGMIRE